MMSGSSAVSVRARPATISTVPAISTVRRPNRAASPPAQRDETVPER